jgi:peptide/nickel transport system permease protein
VRCPRCGADAVDTGSCGECGAVVPAAAVAATATGDLGRYVARRFGYAVLTLFVFWTVVFFRFHPLGDTGRYLLNKRDRPDAFMAQVHTLHLDTPLWVQYVHFPGDSLQGRFGMSFRLEGEAGAVLWNAMGYSLGVLLIGLAICAVFATAMWLVLGAHLPSWVKSGAGILAGCLGIAVLVWTYLAAHDGLPEGLGRYRYYALVPHARDALGDGWQDLLRAGLLAGLVTGGLLGCVFWLTWRHQRIERRAARAAGLAVPPLTLRRVVARSLGRRWGAQVLCAVFVVYTVALSEQAALLRISAGVLHALSETTHDYPVLMASWAICALAVVVGALALSLVVPALDPTVIRKGRREKRAIGTGETGT